MIKKCFIVIFLLAINPIAISQELKIENLPDIELSVESISRLATYFLSPEIQEALLRSSVLEEGAKGIENIIQGKFSESTKQVVDEITETLRNGEIVVEFEDLPKELLVVWFVKPFFIRLVEIESKKAELEAKKLNMHDETSIFILEIREAYHSAKRPAPGSKERNDMRVQFINDEYIAKNFRRHIADAIRDDSNMIYFYLDFLIAHSWKGKMKAGEVADVVLGGFEDGSAAQERALLGLYRGNATYVDLYLEVLDDPSHRLYDYVVQMAIRKWEGVLDLMVGSPDPSSLEGKLIQCIAKIIQKIPSEKSYVICAMIQELLDGFENSKNIKDFAKMKMPSIVEALNQREDWKEIAKARNIHKEIIRLLDEVICLPNSESEESLTTIRDVLKEALEQKEVPLAKRIKERFRLKTALPKIPKTGKTKGNK